MKIYRMPQLAESSPGGACILGPSELNSNAVYLVYGRLLPKETGRAITPKEGFEEVLYLAKGSVTARQGKKSFPVSAGEAFLVKDSVSLDNNGADEAVYITAGGRPLPGDETALKEHRQESKEAGSAGTPAKPEIKGPAVEKDNDEFTITLDDSPDEEGA